MDQEATMDLTFVHGTLDPGSDPSGYAAVRRRGPSAVAIGKFDGLHRGHRALLARLLAEARRGGCQAGVVTFDVSPAEVLRLAGCARLSTLSQRRSLCAEAGVDFMLALQSTPALFATEAEEFAAALIATLDARVIVVGADFRFGRGARGDLATLRSVAAPLGVEVVGVALEELAGRKVSSTRIREELAAGRVDGAATLLGRSFSVTGIVDDRTPLSLSVDVEDGAALPATGVYLGRIALAAVHSRDGLVIAKVVETAEGHRRLRLLSLHGELEGALPGRACTVVFERSASEPQAVRPTTPAH